MSIFFTNLEKNLKFALIKSEKDFKKVHSLQMCPKSFYPLHPIEQVLFQKDQFIFYHNSLKT